MKTEPNDYVYPIVEPKDTVSLTLGLTKRELFAYGAMKAVIASHGEDYPETMAAATAIKYADALITELNKKEEENNKDT